eukprot:14287973-Alexandrium_andersonii.AAC.1
MGCRQASGQAHPSDGAHPRAARLAATPMRRACERGPGGTGLTAHAARQLAVSERPRAGGRCCPCALRRRRH